MADLQAIVARVKEALVAPGEVSNHSAPTTEVTPSLDVDDHRAEMVSRFARELETVGGRVIGPIRPDGMTDCIVNLAQERGIKSFAIGKGVSCDLSRLADGLEAAEFPVVRVFDLTPDRLPRREGEPEKGLSFSEKRKVVREQLARVDAGIAEADYGIAATGTLAVLSDDGRPSSLTLLPPASIVILRVDRMKPDLASALAVIGPEALEAHRMTLVTGPSRTADIEKRIVMGVHGPKSLDVIVVWPADD